MKLAAALLTVTVTFPGLIANAQPASPRTPIARIGEQSVYEEDLFSLIGGQLWQLKLQEYEVKRKALEDLIGQRLLEAEARARGISSESLLEQTVYRGIPVATSSVEAAQRRVKARQDYIDGLRQKASVSVLLVRPRVAVEPDPARLRGDPDAPVTIIEFSDFQCPHCQRAQSPLRAVMEEYQGRIRLGFRDYPIGEIHPHAQSAAEASRCAGDQGHFWEYHDLLFAAGATFDRESLRQYARKTGLNVGRFDSCLDSGLFRASIESDIQLGNISGVSATPAFYINGQLFIGFQDVAALTNVIEAELAAAKVKRPVP